MGLGLLTALPPADEKSTCFLKKDETLSVSSKEKYGVCLERKINKFDPHQ